MTGLIEVVRGRPDDIELAALLAVLLARPVRQSRPPDGTPPAGHAGRVGWHRDQAGYQSPRSWASR